MLLPFERNLLHISNFDSTYIPSLVNDTFRFENVAGGLVFCVTKETTGYILFRKNKPIALSAFSNNTGEQLPKNISFFSILDSSELDIYLNAIEDGDLVTHLEAFFKMPVTFSAPYKLTDMKRLVGFIEAERLSGILGIKHGSVMNTAVFSEGDFSYMNYYHPDTKSYAIEKTVEAFTSYTESMRSLDSYVIFKTFKTGLIDIPERREQQFLQNDPIITLVLCYIDIFELIYKVLKTRLDESQMMDVSNKVFNALRKKYFPLYSTVSYSTETGTVNWNALFDERRYISVEYRFGHYHLYLDELLKLLLKVGESVFGNEMADTLVPRLKNYLVMTDSGDRNLKEMAYRIDKMLEKYR